MSASSFQYHRAADVADALAQGSKPATSYLAGGTDLLQLWKAGVQAPSSIVDISRLPLNGIEHVDGRFSIGALARLSDVADHPAVARDYPLIADAIRQSASGQIRNMATVGGNLLQRTRCPYFRNASLPCNKRALGSGCGARDGENRHAALFGTSTSCVATHASDLAVALAALDAVVEVCSATGRRRVSLSDLYRAPGDAPQRDTTLADGELMTAIHLQSPVRFTRHSTYLKVRDRASFEFAVLSVAVALTIDGGKIVDARLAAGGVAHYPWRLHQSESTLLGRAIDDEAAFAVAGDLAVEGAMPMAHNGFKVELLRRAVVRALQRAGGKV